MPNKHYLDPHIDEQITSYEIIKPMITLEQVKKTLVALDSLENHTMISGAQKPTG